MSLKAAPQRAASAACLASVLLIALAIAAIDPHPSWRHAFYLPILLASLYSGWRSGVITALLAGSAVIYHAGGLTAEPFLFCAVAVAAGLYSGSVRRDRQRREQVVEQLSEVCERLQSNFEGMKRAERLSAIGQLSAGLAHEIRNPLASIAGAASILRRSQPLDAKATRCLDIVEGECKRLNGLLTTFLNFARPRPPQLQSVPVESILDSVIELAQHAIGSKPIEFRREVPASIPPFECDPEQMTQVLLNLVINATEASQPGATVTLAAAQSEETVRILVVDEGCGVPPEDVDKLFNPFFTTKETGTGLGLPVAHQIVGQMGGVLKASRNPSGGMTFSVEFPLQYARKEA